MLNEPQPTFYNSDDVETVTQNLQNKTRLSVDSLTKVFRKRYTRMFGQL